MELKNHKRQKLSEGVEWHSDKVALLESVRKNLGDRWTDDFGKSDTEKPIQEMRKEEYQSYKENLKKKEEAIAIGYRRVSNKYTEDFKENLRKRFKGRA